MNESSRCPVPHRMGVCDRLITVIAPIFQCFRRSAHRYEMRFTNTHGGNAHTTHKLARSINWRITPNCDSGLRCAALLLEINELSFIHSSEYLIYINKKKKKKKSERMFLSRLIDLLNVRWWHVCNVEPHVFIRRKTAIRLISVSSYITNFTLRMAPQNTMRLLHPTSETQNRCRFTDAAADQLTSLPYVAYVWLRVCVCVRVYVSRAIIAVT